MSKPFPRINSCADFQLLTVSFYLSAYHLRISRMHILRQTYIKINALILAFISRHGTNE